MPTCGVEGTQIADIKIVDNAPSQPPPPTAQPPVPPIQTEPLPAARSQPASAQATPTQASQPFVDPAIMSMGRRPTIQAVSSPQPMLQEAPSTPLKMAAAAPAPAKTLPFVGMPKNTRTTDSAATLTAPFSGLDIGDNAETLEILDDTDEPTIVDNGVRRVSITKTRTGKPMDAPPEVSPKKGHRGKRGKKRQEQVSQDYGVLETSPEVTRKAQNGNGQYRGKGWRQTPILQEAGQASPSRTPGVIAGNVGQAAVKSSRKKHKRQKMLEAQQNGWATEEATDIQELPEFDFQYNLNKFDKRSVFDQIRNEDTTADEERLVNHNRLPPRPGTYGGKNLHPTENVLDGPSPRVGTRRSSQTETSSDDFDLLDSGRNSRRAMSRASNKRMPLRTGSNVAEDSPAAGAHSSGHSALPTRSRGSVIGLGIPRTGPSSLSHGSPNIGSSARHTPPTSPSFDRAHFPHALAQQQAYFRLSKSGRTCPTITPGGMGAVEEIAEVEFGIPADILTENAGRGIAEVALAALNPGGRRLAKENLALNARPVCIVLVGNHKPGARAVAASRHLLGRGVRVVACVLGYERAQAGMELDRELKLQLDMLRKLGGPVKSWTDIKRWLQRGEVPVEAVLDALLAPGRKFDELSQDDKVAVAEMVDWVNTGTGRVVVSVDVPSGVNGSTGTLFP